MPPKRIIVLTAFSVFLVLFYTVWSDTSYFLYIIWNIFLAFLPFLISSNLLWYKNQGKFGTPIFIFGLLVWLALFPNAPYLVTDLIHLGANPSVPFIFDFLILFISAWVGMYLGVYSLFHVEEIFFDKYGKKITNSLLFVIILISSFGIYIGRFLRWNSWDVFLRPGYLVKDISEVVNHPHNYPEAYVSTAVFFVFITLSYLVWKKIKK